MFYYYRKDVEANLINNKYPHLSDEDVNNLLMLTEAVEMSNRHDINKPPYDAYHINRFLNCQNISGVTYMYNKKLDFGKVSRIFSREENICDNFSVYREILLESFKRKYNINSTPTNTFCISDRDPDAFAKVLGRGITKFFFDPEKYPNNMMSSDFLKIKDFDISDKTFFPIVLSKRQKTVSLTEMIDYNLDDTYSLIEYIYNNTPTDVKIVLITRGFYTNKFKKIISFFSKYFKECGTYSTLVDVNKYSNFVYFFNKTQNNIKKIPIDKIKIEPSVDNGINYTWKEITQIKIKLTLETKILNYLLHQVDTFNVMYDFYQLIILKDNIRYVETYNIPYNIYYSHLLKEKQLLMIPQIKTISPNIGLNYAIIPDNVIDYYKKIRIESEYKPKDLLIDVIKTIDDITFFDLCNNNFILETNKNYYADPASKELVDKYTQFYNINVKYSETNYNYLFINEFTYDIYKLLTNINLDCKIIIKIDIFKKHLHENLNNLFRTFENKFFYAPLMGQLYTSYIYVILDKYNESLNNVYYVDFEKIIYSYVTNNKLMIDYAAILFGKEYLEKEFMKDFLNNL